LQQKKAYEVETSLELRRVLVRSKNTNTIIDKRFKRNFSLYRKFGNTQIFRTNLYTMSNDKIEFDTSRYVYYLQENNVIYYLDIRSEEHTSELQSRFDLVCLLLLE